MPRKYLLLLLIICLSACSDEKISLQGTDAQTLRFNINLSSTALDALQHGFALHFVSQVKISEESPWFRQNLYQQQGYCIIRLSALTETYTLEKENGLIMSFPDSDSLLSACGEISIPPVLLTNRQRAVVHSRLYLDLLALPLPLRIQALSSEDWWHHSGWQQTRLGQG